MKHQKKIIELLNKIMEFEMAGVVRYNHYALMVFGYNRIPIVSWLRSEADSSIIHAQEAGEMITALGGTRHWVSAHCWKPTSMISATFCVNLLSRRDRPRRCITIYWNW